MQTLKWERTVTPGINISFHFVSCIALLSQRAVTLLPSAVAACQFFYDSVDVCVSGGLPNCRCGLLRIGCVHGIVNFDVISSDGGAYISMNEPFEYNNEKKNSMTVREDV